MSTNQKYIIIKDRVEVYKDFTMNLLYNIFHYYIDSESLSADEDIRNHFVWCYNRVCDEFIKEGINFKKNEELKEYFYSFYYHQFYVIQKQNQDVSLEYYENFWKNIFDVEKQKNKNFINILIEIYNVYDKSINKEKNILEIV